MAKKLLSGYAFNKRRKNKLRHHPFVIPVVVFFALFIASAIVFVNIGGETIGASDSRTVQLSVDDQVLTLPTRAATVSELLERLDIKLHEKDIVEPSRDAQIIENDFRINIYRAELVSIVDGDKRVNVFSAQPTPRLIAEEAGVKLYPEDNIEIGIADDALRDAVVGHEVVIDRATPVFLNLYGKMVEIRSQAQTVGDVLNEKQIKPLEGDTVEPALDTPIVPNTQIFVVQHGKQIVSVEEEIPQPLETILDPNILEGRSVVKSEGSPGKRLVTYELTLENGQEVSRTAIQTVIVSIAQKRVVLKGTKVVYSNPSANVELGRQIAIEMGYGSQFDCIYNLFERESHWNHLARNRSSGAYGIPQALPGSKMGPGWETEPDVQIRWGINYTVSKYGGPCKAWSFWQVNHWY